MRKYRDSSKSEMDSQRELLDSLMGLNRNNDKGDNQVMDFRDERVCKFFITGMCPNDIFVNTKMDEGPCMKVHSEALKAAFERHGDPHMYDSLIEREFQSKVLEADRVIKRARARIEEEKIDESINPDINPEVIRLNGVITAILNDAEKAAEEDDIDKAQELILMKLEDVLKEKAAVVAKISEQKRILMQKSGADNNKKLRVCDVCGSFLSIFDSDKRLSDHFLGKQHIGFQYMRDAIEAVRVHREESRAKGREDRDKDRSVKDPAAASSDSRDGRRSSREEAPSRRRDDSRDRDRNRDRDRDRDRGDGYNRDRDRDRGGRDRDRDRRGDSRGRR